MQETKTYQLQIKKQFNENELQKGVYIAVIHATRIPPHVGLVIDGKYYSLSIKGRDINIPVSVLVKNSSIRKIPTLFIKIKVHSTFSNVYLSEQFISNIQQFERVDVGIATCLSPIKLFFEEAYSVSMQQVNYLFELLPKLEQAGILEYASSMNIEKDYRLPVYTSKEINAGINQVRTEFKN